MKYRAFRDRIISLSVIFAVLLTDIFTKRWAVNVLRNLPGEQKGGLKGLFHFRFAWNTGAAFSFLENAPGVIMAVTFVLIAVLFLFVFLPPRAKLSERICLSMVFAGGLGNFIDRLVYGAVADFIEFEFMRFPVFNAADISVVTGAVLFAIIICFPLKKGGVK